MFALAWVFLPDMPEYRTGLILVGLARCIAMVLIWNVLACGSGELAAVLVALNSVFQILAYSVLGWLFLTVVPGWFGAESAVARRHVARSPRRAIFLGVPLVAGYLTRRVVAQGAAWYDGASCLVRAATLLGLLHTIVLMFAMQGHRITRSRSTSLRISVPLLVYFGLMSGSPSALAPPRLRPTSPRRRSRSPRRATTSSSPSPSPSRRSASARGEALAGVVGPLIEVPALVGLVYVSLWAPGTSSRRGPARPARPAGPTDRSDRPTVLFVCVHNAGRSQMAAGWLRHLSGGAVEVRSAGSTPADEVNPSAVAAMAEVGVDIAAEVPKVLTPDAVRAPTSSSPWGAATPARSTRGSGTRTGRSTTRPGRVWMPCVPSVTTSAGASSGCSRASASRRSPQPEPAAAVTEAGREAD